MSDTHPKCNPDCKCRYGWDHMPADETREPLVSPDGTRFVVERLGLELRAKKLEEALRGIAGGDMRLSKTMARCALEGAFAEAPEADRIRELEDKLDRAEDELELMRLKASAWQNQATIQARSLVECWEKTERYRAESESFRQRLFDAVNASCSCGGNGRDLGCCQACEVWHRFIASTEEGKWEEIGKVETFGKAEEIGKVETFGKAEEIGKWEESKGAM